jgi:hypothetical protein
MAIGRSGLTILPKNRIEIEAVSAECNRSSCDGYLVTEGENSYLRSGEIGHCVDCGTSYEIRF